MAHTVEIDFDVYKLIESERRGFDDPPLAALRRLLGLAELPVPEAIEIGAGKPWIGDGVMLEHGTRLRMPYDRNRKLYEGRVVDGRWLVDGNLYDSPSGAAAGVARTKKGKPTSLNGWGYWEFKRPGSDEWKRIEEERTKKATPPRKI
jgi:hypothetical protein